MRLITLSLACSIAVTAACGPGAPPTSVPAAAPTIAPPTIVPTLAPTAAPLPTVAAAPPPTAASQPTQAPSAAVSDCDNPFYPVRPTARWEYRITGTVPASFTETRVNIGPSSFTSRMVFPDITVDNDWHCTADGLLASQTNRLTMAQGQMRFDALSSSGVTIPREPAWTAGHRWHNEFQIRTTQVPGIQGTADGKIAVDNVLVGQESVSVPAGSYQGMKVNQNTRLDLTVSLGETTMPMSLSFSGVSWFARGVGLVKHEVTGEIGDGTTELVSFSP